MIGVGVVELVAEVTVLARDAHSTTRVQTSLGLTPHLVSNTLNLKSNIFIAMKASALINIYALAFKDLNLNLLHANITL